MTTQDLPESQVPISRMLGEMLLFIERTEGAPSVVIEDVNESAYGRTLSTDPLLKIVTNKATYIFYHEQDCCESVYLEDIAGIPTAMRGERILLAEDVSSADHPLSDATTTPTDPDPNGDVEDWTFYKLATLSGYATLRFIGSSNGYYSTSVSIARIPHHIPTILRKLEADILVEETLASLLVETPKKSYTPLMRAHGWRVH